jgi:hypothetical protein
MRAETSTWLKNAGMVQFEKRFVSGHRFSDADQGLADKRL